MKKFLSLLCCALAAAIALLAAPAALASAASIPAENVSIRPATVKLEPGGTMQLTATVTPFNSTDTILWHSNDESVATVSAKGLVTARSVGTATITAYSKETTLTAADLGTCTVTVTRSVTGVSLGQTGVTLNIGDSATLTASVFPSDATNPNVTWTLDDPDSVVTLQTIPGSPTSRTIKGVKKGTARVTVTTADGGKTASCTITVVQPVAGIVISKKNASDSTSLKVGNTLELQAAVSPSDASETDVQWTSDNASVASVDGDGKVTALRDGTAKITAYIGSVTSNVITVSVSSVPVTGVKLDMTAIDRDLIPPEITPEITDKAVLVLNKDLNQICTLKAVVYPDGTAGPAASNQTVRWSIKDGQSKTVVSVDQTGRVIPLGGGDTIIVVTTDGVDSNGRSKTAECKVHVNESLSSIILTPKTSSLTKGSSTNLAITYIPNSANVNRDLDPARCTSSDPKVASVSVSEATQLVTVTAVGPGRATITITTKGGLSSQCTVTVTSPVTKVTITPEADSLPAGSTLKIGCAIEPSDATNATVGWTVTPAGYATIRDGVLTAVRPGKVTVYAVAGGIKSNECVITIDPIRVTGVTLDLETATIGMGSSLKLTPVVSPANATNKNVTWTSSDEKVVKVLNGKLTPVSVGTATVTVTTEDGGKTAECKVTVTAAAATDVKLSSIDPVTIDVGGTAKFTAVLTPRSAVDTVTWTPAAGSGNDFISLRYASETGNDFDKVVIVTGKKPGETTVSVSLNDAVVPSVCKVTVSGVILELPEGKTELEVGVGRTITAVKKLYGTAKTLDSTDWEWTSDNESVARVSPSTGQITGIAKGTAKITCTQGKYSDSVTVRVTEGGSNAITKEIKSGNTFSFSEIRSNLGRSVVYVTNMEVSADVGTLYYGYTSAADTGAGVAASDRLYLTAKSAGDKLLDRVTFVAKPGFSGEAVVRYTAFLDTGDSYSGEIHLKVPKTTVISYTSQGGEAVYFHSGSFSDVCKPQFGYPVASVCFTAPPERYGFLYYDYPGGEIFGSNVSESKRYYASSTPSLDSVVFVPRKGYTGSFTFPYTGWDTAGNTFTGEISITVTAAPGQAGSGDLSYTARSGQRLYFDPGDFSELCRSVTGGALDYVQFTALPDAAQAVLYAGSGGTSKVSSLDTKYYYSSSLRQVNILPDAGYTGTLSISFTGFDTDGKSFSGSVVVTVAKSGGEVQTVYKESDGMPVSFQRSEFADVCRGLPADLKSVRFNLPDSSAGKLYESFRNLQDNKPLAAGADLPAAGLTGLVFVPKGNFSGSTYFSYTATDQKGNTCTGSVRVYVWPAETSQFFSDMKSAPWAVSSVDFLRWYGVVNGTSLDGTTFSPTQEMRRADFVLMLSRAFALPSMGNESFSDVPGDSYYAQALSAAKAKGIATADASGRFYPTQGITRQDAAVFLYRALRAAGQSPAGDAYDLAPFLDGGEIAGYARDAMAALVNMGVFQGNGAGRIMPNQVLSRAEMAAILHRAIT